MSLSPSMLITILKILELHEILCGKLLISFEVLHKCQDFFFSFVFNFLKLRSICKTVVFEAKESQPMSLSVPTPSQQHFGRPGLQVLSTA